MSQCRTCGISWSETALFRVNQLGEVPAIWSCRTHLTKEQRKLLDPYVSEICDAIEADNNKAEK